MSSSLALLSCMWRKHLARAFTGQYTPPFRNTMDETPPYPIFLITQTQSSRRCTIHFLCRCCSGNYCIPTLKCNIAHPKLDSASIRLTPFCVCIRQLARNSKKILTIDPQWLYPLRGGCQVQFHSSVLLWDWDWDRNFWHRDGVPPLKLRKYQLDWF